MRLNIEKENDFAKSEITIENTVPKRSWLRRDSPRRVPPLTDRQFAVTRRNPSRLRIKLRRGRRLALGMTGAIQRKSTIRYCRCNIQLL